MAEMSEGKMAETLALFFLRLKGYRLVERNYRIGRGTGAGEIDLIVRRGTTLVFVEVKKRQDLNTAAYAILPKQQQRIRRSAEAFIGWHQKYANFDVRFDAVLVELPFKIRHLENAF